MGETACGTGDRRYEALSVGGATRCIVPLSALVWTLTLVLLLVVAGLAGPGSVRAAEDTPAGEEEVQVGDGDTFTAVDWGNGSGSLEISATVRAVGEHAALWVEDGRYLPLVLRTGLAEDFDTSIYPALTDLLSPVPEPGVDGRHRVDIFFYGIEDQGLAGYFDAEDMDPSRPGFAGANQRELLYVNRDFIAVQPEKARAVIAHELAHLLMHYRSEMEGASPQREPQKRWVQEGLSVYAEAAAGDAGRTSRYLESFQEDPGENLTGWGGYRADYGAAYAFISYLVQRTAPDILGQILDEPRAGAAGLDSVLEARDSPSTFATLFDDWVMANFLDGRPPVTYPFHHDTLDIQPSVVNLQGPLPYVGTIRVPNYGAVYLDLPLTSGDVTVSVTVDGVDGAPLQAALIGWDGEGLHSPTVSRFTVDSGSAGGWVVMEPGTTGYDHHTLALWARGQEGVQQEYSVRVNVSTGADGGPRFLDVGGDHVFYPYIAALAESGVVVGTEVPPGSGLFYFRPYEEVLRAQFAKMIMGAMGLHTEEIPREGLDASTFPDVPPSYSGGQPLPYPIHYVEEAAAAGIVTGFLDVSFGPWKPITRIQLVRMILRGADVVDAPFPSYQGEEEVFMDVPPGSTLYPEVMTAYENGIMSGKMVGGERYFSPRAEATRGQVAKMTANLMDILE